MQGRGNIKPPVGITFDSDFGNSIDSFLTLGFLQSASGKGQARVISVSISQSSLKAAQAAEAVLPAHPRELLREHITSLSQALRDR